MKRTLKITLCFLLAISSICLEGCYSRTYANRSNTSNVTAQQDSEESSAETTEDNSAQAQSKKKTRTSSSWDAFYYIDNGKTGYLFSGDLTLYSDGTYNYSSNKSTVSGKWGKTKNSSKYKYYFYPSKGAKGYGFYYSSGDETRLQLYYPSKNLKVNFAKSRSDAQWTAEWPTTNKKLLAIPSSQRYYNAYKKVGTRCTIAGPVYNLVRSTTSRGEYCWFIDIGNRKNQVSIVIWADAYSSYKKTLDAFYNSLANGDTPWIKYTGYLTSYNGSPQFNSNNAASWTYWKDA